MSFPIWQRVLMRESKGQAHVYSVSFSDPTVRAGVREDQARDLVVDVARDGRLVRNDFDRISIFQRPVFNATWNSKQRRWEKLVARGEPDFSWSPTDVGREVVYRCRPFWYRLDVQGKYAPYRVSVADRPTEGFLLAPMFRNETDFVYRPVFEMTVDAKGVPHSRAGGTPLCTSPDVLMKTVQAYDSAARLESVRDWFSDMLLQLVEFATWDIGTLMPGNRAVKLAATGAAIKGIESSLGDLGDGYGCVWRGKENPWKNVNSCLCDLLGQKVVGSDGSVSVMFFYLPDMSKYTGQLNEHYVRLGFYLPNMVCGYTPVSGFGYSEYGILLPGMGTGGGAAVRSLAYQATAAALSADDFLIRVGVGGGSCDALLPASEPSSPFHWEASQRDCAQDQYFGGRLVLEEA